VVLQPDGFLAQAIDRESARLGVSAAELVAFSVLYYLADVDSGRIARQIAKIPRSDRQLGFGSSPLAMSGSSPISD
jgi:hypothetical protein